jgi:hypothetical protein
MFHGTSCSNCSQHLQVAVRSWRWWWPLLRIPPCSSLNRTFGVASIYSVPSSSPPNSLISCPSSSLDIEPLSEIQ